MKNWYTNALEPIRVNGELRKAVDISCLAPVLLLRVGLWSCKNF